MNTIRQQILNILQTTLQDYPWHQVTPEAVHIGRTSFDPDTDTLPLITIVPGLETSDVTRYRTNECVMPIGVSALVSTDGGGGASIIGEAVFGELHKALFSNLNALMDLGSISYTGGGIAEYPDTPAGKAIITIGVNLDVHYETLIGNPYHNGNTNISINPPADLSADRNPAPGT